MINSVLFFSFYFFVFLYFYFWQVLIAFFVTIIGFIEGQKSPGQVFANLAGFARTQLYPWTMKKLESK